jgi:hypothetical protein
MLCIRNKSDRTVMMMLPRLLAKEVRTQYTYDIRCFFEKGAV